MADVYDTIQYDASNTLNLTGILERSLQTFAEPIPGSTGVPAVAHTPTYLERFTWKGCTMTYANFNTLRTAIVSTTAITSTQATWPNIVVYDQAASPPTITTTTFLVMWAGYSNAVRGEDSNGPFVKFDFHCWVRGTPGTGFNLTLTYSGASTVTVYWCTGAGVVDQSNTITTVPLQGEAEYQSDKTFIGGRTIQITGYIAAAADFDKISQMADRTDAGAVSGGYLASFSTNAVGSYYVENLKILRQYHAALWKVSFILREENEPT